MQAMPLAFTDTVDVTGLIDMARPSTTEDCKVVAPGGAR
jgi:hypothetical protein